MNRKWCVSFEGNVHRVVTHDSLVNLALDAKEMEEMMGREMISIVKYKKTNEQGGEAV